MDLVYKKTSAEDGEETITNLYYNIYKGSSETIDESPVWDYDNYLTIQIDDTNKETGDAVTKTCFGIYITDSDGTMAIDCVESRKNN